VQFDCESNDLVLESAKLRGVLGLSPQLLAQAVDFHGPARLMSFLAKLGPLGPGGGLSRGHLGGFHSLSQLRNVGRQFGCLPRRRFLAPDLKDPRRLADGTVTVAKLPPQSATGEASAARQDLAARTTDSVVGQSLIHRE
jgi:hypothetical protein